MKALFDPIPWWVLVIGFAGQALFFSRFLVQWIVSEIQRRSVVPLAFWFLSLGGAVLLLCYGFFRRDPVIVLGQSVGFLVYSRNLVLIYRERRQSSSQSWVGLRSGKPS